MISNHSVLPVAVHTGGEFYPKEGKTAEFAVGLSLNGRDYDGLGNQGKTSLAADCALSLAATTPKRSLRAG